MLQRSCGVEGSGVAGSREGRSMGVTGTEVVVEELSCIEGSSVEVVVWELQKTLRRKAGA